MTFIHDAIKLTSIFGKWPSFHDSQILKIEMDRDSPTIDLRIWLFERTREVDERGFYKTQHECVATLRFDEVREVYLDGFNHQNVISGIVMQPGPPIEVSIEPLNGVGGRFNCRSVAVIDVCLSHPDRDEPDDQLRL